MDKKAAAEALGVSEKTISRYVSSGRLASQYVRGKTGQILDFDPAEIDRLKEDLAQPVARSVEVAQGATKGPGQDRSEDGQSSVLATLDPILPIQNHAQVSALAELVRAVMNAGQAETGQVKPPSLGEKMLLTIEEARALTGLSRGVLLDAIKAGELPARTIGRGYKLRPVDIENWLGSIFGDTNKKTATR